jgi:hypothetical protein
MQLPDIKQLKAVILTCRKLGVKTVKIGELEITLGEAPAKAGRKAGASVVAEPSEELTQEQLLMWSVQ